MGDLDSVQDLCSVQDLGSAQGLDSIKGFRSIEEAVQAYIDLFAALRRDEGEEGSPQDKKEFFMNAKRRLEERERLTEIFLPALYLRERCALTEAEYWLAMLAFCCEVEEGLCAGCGGSRTGNVSGDAGWPAIHYALHLLSLALPIDFGLIAELCRRRGGLGDILRLRPADAWAQAERGMLSQPLLLNRSAFYFLLTGGLQREDWYELFLAGGPEAERCGRNSLSLHAREYDSLCGYLGGMGQPRILLSGDRGSGRHTLVRRACRERQRNAVFVKLPLLWREEGQNRDSRLQQLRLICSLADPVIILDLTGRAWDASFMPAPVPERAEAMLEAFVSGELGNRPLIFLAEDSAWEEAAGRLAQVRVDLREALTREELKQALDAWLPPEERCGWQEELLDGYRLNIGELERTQRAVCLRAEAEHISPADRRAWQMGLPQQGVSSRLGRLVKADCQLDDLVLPGECRAQLETVIQLAERWSGGGLQLLFHGSSGTGKTMAASALAGELRRPLFKVDLSQIYDKYIGETEKHLDEIFRLARRGRYMLFFDEADTLFARRTNVRDSHDKYANLSTAYLLQRIEEYDGIVVLATNLMDHFDDAFVRRIRFVVRFHNLDAEGRRRLWEKALGGVPAVSEDVSFEELAQAACFSPARIKSAAQVAKLLAGCGESGIVTREHIRKALELEAGKDETALKGLGS